MTVEEMEATRVDEEEIKLKEIDDEKEIKKKRIK